MWIKRIEIGQFGNLRDLSVSFDPLLNVIAAPNEAGKSTLIDFIFAALYGMDSNHADPRRSNRRRNMPWGEHSMSGTLVLEDDASVYRVDCQFGEANRFDERTLLDVATGQTVTCDDRPPLGQTLFDLSEAAFLQSVYVRQMSVALDVADVRSGDLAHRLANLSTAGAADTSKRAVEDRLIEEHRHYTSERRQAAVLPTLRRQLAERRQAYRQAVQRERDEAEELRRLADLEIRHAALSQACEQAIAKEKKTRFLITAQEQLIRLEKERGLRQRAARLDRQKEYVCDFLREHRAEDPEYFLNDYKAVVRRQAPLVSEINQLRLEQNTLETDRQKVRAQQARKAREAEAGATEQAELQAELEEWEEQDRSDQAQKAQLEHNLSQLDAVPPVPSLREEARARRLKRSGGVLIALSVIAAVGLGLFVNPMGALAALGALAGGLLVMRGRRLERDQARRREAHARQVAAYHETQASLETVCNRVEAGRERRRAIRARLEELERDDHDFTDGIRLLDRRQQDFRQREKHLNEKLRRFTAETDALVLRHDYLQYADQLQQIADGRTCEPPVLPAPLADDEALMIHDRFEKACARLSDLQARAEQQQTFLSELDRQEDMLRAEYRGLGGDGAVSPTAAWQSLIERAALQDLPHTEEDILSAIADEPVPDNLELSHVEREQATQRIRRERDELMNVYNEQKALVTTQYREVERSETIDRQIRELEARLTQAEAFVRSLERAMEALKRANEDMRRHFTEPLRAKTAAYLRFLTDGRYRDVTVDERMQMTVQAEGDPLRRKAEYLSGGSYDQVYLALRLAIAELITAERTPPLILDDIFTQFDDARTVRGIELLKKIAEEERRQVLLFTCRGTVGKAAVDRGFYAPTFG